MTLLNPYTSYLRHYFFVCVEIVGKIVSKCWSCHILKLLRQFRTAYRFSLSFVVFFRAPSADVFFLNSPFSETLTITQNRTLRDWLAIDAYLVMNLNWRRRNGNTRSLPIQIRKRNSLTFSCKS